MPGLFTKYTKGGLSKGLKVRDSQKSIQSLSKATGKLGTKYRLFVPVQPGRMNDDGSVASWDLTACTVAGRKLDFNIFGSTFFVYTEKDCQINEETGKITKDLTNLHMYDSVVGAMYNAQMNEEMAIAQERYDKAVKEGQPVSQSDLDQELNLIKDLYIGKSAERQAAVLKMRAKNKDFRSPERFMSRLGIEHGTCAVIVELEQNKANLDTVKAVSIPALSNVRIKDLQEAANSPNCVHDFDGIKFVEVEYNVIGNDIDEAKRNAKFHGVENGGASSAFALLSDSEKQELNNEIKSKLIVDDAVMEATISKYNPDNISSDTVESKTREYLTKKKATFKYLDTNSDSAKWAANDIKELGIFNDVINITSGKSIQQTIDDILNEKNSEKIKENLDIPTGGQVVPSDHNLSENDIDTV